MIFLSSNADLSSLTGQNVNFLMYKYKKTDLKALVMAKNSIKKARVHPLPHDESWKINILQEICLLKKDHIDIEFDEKNLDDILEFVCTA